MTRAALLLATVALVGCDRTAPAAPDNYEATAAVERAAAEANEQAWIDRMRADVARNAALAAELENLTAAEDPFLNLPEPLPAAENVSAEPPAPAAPQPPSDADLRAAEAAVRDAMKRRSDQK